MTEKDKIFNKNIYAQMELLEEHLKEHVGIPVVSHELTENFALTFEKVLRRRS